MFATSNKTDDGQSIFSKYKSKTFCTYSQRNCKALFRAQLFSYLKMQ